MKIDLFRRILDINVTGNITTDGSSGLNDSEGVYVNEVGGNVDITCEVWNRM